MKTSKEVRGQLKIQEMAFVLMAIMIFFGIIALIFSSMMIGNLRKDANILRENQAQELVKKLTNIPELSWVKDCSNCLDHDKLLALKERKSYEGLWAIDYLAVEQLYPKKSGGECTKSNYPNCNITSVFKDKEEIGKTSFAFVSLCRWDRDRNYNVCELARLVVSGKGINEN